MGLLSLAGMGCGGELFGEVAQGSAVGIGVLAEGQSSARTGDSAVRALRRGVGGLVLQCPLAAVWVAVLAVPSHTRASGRSAVVVALVLGWL